MIGATAQAILSRRSVVTNAAQQAATCASRSAGPLSPDPVPAVPVPLARASDPQTSKRAGARAETFKAAQEAKIFNAIYEAGAHGATANEIAPRIGLKNEQVNRRLSGLGERNLIHRVLKETALTAKDFVERGRCAVWWKT